MWRRSPPSRLGTFWVYEGGTLGFRTLHVYLPESGLIMAMGLNSEPADDQIIALALSVDETLVSQGALPAPCRCRRLSRRVLGAPDRARVIAALSVLADTAQSVTGPTRTVEDLLRAVRVSL